jgi:DNA-binding response OmpR family regulator
MLEQSKARILLVEDEEQVLKSLERFFSRQGFEVHGAQNPQQALHLAQTKLPDIAVLDVMLHESGGGKGEVDGFEICKQLRDNGFDRPVIFLTARSSEEDKLLGFEVGADDYVTKPFSLPELLARVNANLRRVGGVKHQFSYAGNIVVDLDMHEIRHGSEIEQLSKRERDLLAFFIKNSGKILTRDQLLQEVWGYKSGVHTRTVDTHVLTVRKKLRDNAQVPQFIQTLHGVGYKFIGSSE